MDLERNPDGMGLLSYRSRAIRKRSGIRQGFMWTSTADVDDQQGGWQTKRETPLLHDRTQKLRHERTCQEPKSEDREGDVDECAVRRDVSEKGKDELEVDLDQ